MSGEDVKAHHVLYRVMQHQAEKIKINHRVEARGQVMEQRSKIALLRDGFAHFEQGFELTPGVLQRRSLRHFRRRDDAFRHKRQDSIRLGGGSTQVRTEKAFTSRAVVVQKIFLKFLLFLVGEKNSRALVVSALARELLL